MTESRRGKNIHRVDTFHFIFSIPFGVGAKQGHFETGAALNAPLDVVSPKWCCLTVAKSAHAYKPDKRVIGNILQDLSAWTSVLQWKHGQDSFTADPTHLEPRANDLHVHGAGSPADSSHISVFRSLGSPYSPGNQDACSCGQLAPLSIASSCHLHPEAV